MGVREHGNRGDWRAKVWSMPGGPNCRPKHWRRNTAFALLGCFLICIPVAIKSAQFEFTCSDICSEPQMMKSYVWFHTADGSIQQVEQEVAMLCPAIYHEIHAGKGTSKNHSICLPERPVSLTEVFEALARTIEGKTPDEIREIFCLPDDLTEEKLEPLENITDDPRIRLLNRLYAKRRKELKEEKFEGGRRFHPEAEFKLV